MEDKIFYSGSRDSNKSNILIIYAQLKTTPQLNIAVISPDIRRFAKQFKQVTGHRLTYIPTTVKIGYPPVYRVSMVPLVPEKTFRLETDILLNHKEEVPEEDILRNLAYKISEDLPVEYLKELFNISIEHHPQKHSHLKVSGKITIGRPEQSYKDPFKRP